LGGGGAHHIASKPVIEQLHQFSVNWPLHIAKQDNALMIRLIGSVVNVGFIKHDWLTIFPEITLTIYVNKALGIIWSD
jgi:hypothetical protein